MTLVFDLIPGGGAVSPDDVFPRDHCLFSPFSTGWFAIWDATDFSLPRRLKEGRIEWVNFFLDFSSFLPPPHESRDNGQSLRGSFASFGFFLRKCSLEGWPGIMKDAMPGLPGRAALRFSGPPLVDPPCILRKPRKDDDVPLQILKHVFVVIVHRSVTPEPLAIFSFSSSGRGVFPGSDR